VKEDLIRNVQIENLLGSELLEIISMFGIMTLPRLDDERGQAQ